MIVTYVFIGIIMAFLGGLPLGASNLAVINRSSSKSVQEGMKIAYGAGFGEIALAFIALCYSRVLTVFFQMNPWIQLSFVFLFLAIGIYLVLPSRFKFKISLPKRSGLKQSQFSLGFFLALLNPPVLIFWTLVIVLIQKFAIPLSDMSPTHVLLLFFSGVFLGKVTVLYLYARWSRRFQQKNKKENSILFRYVGLALVIISVAQGIRFFVS